MLCISFSVLATGKNLPHVSIVSAIFVVYGDGKSEPAVVLAISLYTHRPTKMGYDLITTPQQFAYRRMLSCPLSTAHQKRHGRLGDIEILAAPILVSSEHESTTIVLDTKAIILNQQSTGSQR